MTVKPRASRIAPTEAAAIPLPRDETTPPVTKMYLVAMGLFSLLRQIRSVRIFSTRSRSSAVSTPIDARSTISTRMRNSVLQRAELLQRLAALERRRRESRQPQQGLPLVAVDPQVLQRRAPPSAGDRGWPSG